MSTPSFALDGNRKVRFPVVDPQPIAMPAVNDNGADEDIQPLDPVARIAWVAIIVLHIIFWLGLGFLAACLCLFEALW
jgi:hypothetical protein